jgi:peptide/nickel transport system substrate-binding protein
LHQQALAWGVSKTTHVIQPPNNSYRFTWVTKD